MLGSCPTGDHRWSVTQDRLLAPRKQQLLEPEPGWRPGDTISVELPDGPSVRCRIVAVLEDGTIQVVSEHSVTEARADFASGVVVIPPGPW
jgi:hypothetical protein